ncbi:UvrD-helicase domain-containing protein [Staphylococcus simulans]|uniref:UvrD-helicase domain-containing protein n=1 Tax=Staphylococcus simulans TaxID=1286 RepID=UPI001E383B2F|nr:UvrD-helicase domain-containing protein [Staphylococcus simulans]MCD8915436.1 UvrD-helicase domain-containing protein [Staphylococcus simulans]
MSIPKLIGHQTEILYVPDNQNMVITGSAGCGKSLLAIYRIYWLSKKYPTESIVLLTFNRAVNDDMNRKLKYLAEQWGDGLPQNLTIMTYHKFMREVLQKLVANYSDRYYELNKYIGSKKLIPYNSNRNVQIKAALEKVKEKYSDEDESTFNRPLQTFIDEVIWLQQMSVDSYDMYEEMERIGRRGTRVERSKRKYFYEVYEAYLEIRKEENRHFDFEDIGSIICKIIEKLKDEPNIETLTSYKYILVDEFQDFTSDMLKTVNVLSDSTGAMVLLGDINQGVFGKRISYKSLGIDMRSYKKYQLNQNYRNSKPISEFALKLSQSKYFDKSNEFYAEAKLGVGEGPKPKIMKYDNESDELTMMYQFLSSNTIQKTDRSVCVILPTIKAQEFTGYMKHHGLNVVSVKDKNKFEISKLFYGTYREIKGLEFDIVIMPFLSESIFIKSIMNDNKELEIDKDDWNLEDIDDEILEAYIAQYYVGVTRAKEKLVIIHSGNRTPLMPEGLFGEYVAE